MKESIIKVLHLIFGYENYLKIFSVLKVHTLSLDKRKSDFRFFEKLLVDNATVLVIGACTGITTVPLARKKKYRTVLAYEALPSNYKILNRVIEYFKLKNISTYSTGLGNVAERREIILPVIRGVKKHGMAHILDPAIRGYNVGFSETIELCCLDEREELQNRKIDAIKIVAENFEYQILEGAKVLLKTNKPFIYCELWDNLQRDKVLSLILTYGYNVFYRIDQQLIPYESGSYSGKNFFFQPADE